MRLIRDLHSVRESTKPSVVSIGNYDGVHVGHVKILDLLKAKSDAIGGQATVLTFEPHPHEFFSPMNAPPRLIRWRDKLEKLKAQDVHQVMTLRFNETLSQTSAEDFVKQVLVDALNTQHVVIGDDFRFGRKRHGDVAMLESLGHQYGFSLTTIDTCMLEGERISSTRIREALRADDFDLAHRLLGYPFAIRGRVAHGDKRGRTIGFPTANIILPSDNLPVWGVYAVKAHFKNQPSKTGVANVGIRPTVGGDRVLLETHLFDFDGDVYGCRIEIEFASKIRNEEKFESFQQLKDQIERDAAAARAWFEINSESGAV